MIRHTYYPVILMATLLTTVSACLLAHPGHAQRASVPQAEGPSTVDLLPLHSWWSPGRQDNYATTDNRWSGSRGDRRSPDYGYHRFEGYLYKMRGAPAQGRKLPVYSWYSPSRGDNLLTSDPGWSQSAGTRSPDYRFVRVEGYIHDPKRPQPPGTLPLFSWWHPERGDNFVSTHTKWSMPIASIRWNGEHISNGPKREGYQLYRLEGYVKSPPQPSPTAATEARGLLGAQRLRAANRATSPGDVTAARVASRHGAFHSRAARQIRNQFSLGSDQLDLGDTGHRFRLPEIPIRGRAGHYQGVGFLRDGVVNGVRHRRVALTYSDGPGFAVAGGRLAEHASDGVVAWDHNRMVQFQDAHQFLDITDQPSMGDHGHPGGMQAHGDWVAVAMEKQKQGGAAAVYFIQVAGITPRFVSALPLGSGGAPEGLNAKDAAAAGFLKLKSGFLVAASGAKNGQRGIWFYRTTSETISPRSQWRFVDYWEPSRLPAGVCDIDKGKIGSNCYIGAGGGASLVAGDDGEVYLMVTTGTGGGGYDDEFAQLFHVALPTETPGRVTLNLLRFGKKKLGQLARRHISMRWSGAAHTTQDGRLLLLSTEAQARSTRPNDATDGMIRVSR